MHKKFIALTLLVLLLGISSAFAQGEGKYAEKVPISGGIINGKAKTLVKPAYPAAARAVRAEGAVNVQVTIDEEGSVIAAAAVSGHPLLRAAAVEAARASKFAPTVLSGQPVKVTGVIVYNFVAGTPALAPSAEKMRHFGLGMVLGSLGELDSEPALDNLAFEAARFNDPALVNFLEPLKRLPNLTKDKKIETVNEVVAALDNALTGSEAWQWEMGKNFGGIVTQMRLRKQSGGGYKTDGDILRARLLKIRDLSYSVPADIPADVAEKLRSFAAFLDQEDLSDDEKLAAIGVRVADLLRIIAPLN
ncbi:MAG TPA: TonB family protein [Pyrinomonadaceae bacterium]|jgi:protein TonB